jgi:hypothetical protein
MTVKILYFIWYKLYGNDLVLLRQKKKAYNFLDLTKDII